MFCDLDLCLQTVVRTQAYQLQESNNLVGAVAVVAFPGSVTQRWS